MKKSSNFYKENREVPHEMLEQSLIIMQENNPGNLQN